MTPEDRSAALDRVADEMSSDSFAEAVAAAEALDDVMPCGCCSGSCYCDDDDDYLTEAKREDDYDATDIRNIESAVARGDIGRA